MNATIYNVLDTFGEDVEKLENEIAKTVRYLTECELKNTSDAIITSRANWTESNTSRDVIIDILSDCVDSEACRRHSAKVMAEFNIY